MAPTPDYRLRLLGGASIEGPEGPLTGRPAQRNALALMAVLAAAPDRTLPRDTIAALLWPERQAKRARHLLNVTTYQIRKALGEETLISVNGGLHLSAEAVESDVETFGRAVEAERWEEAEVLFTGAFLDGFNYDGSEAFERWAERERWRCERLYRIVLERLAEAAEGPGEAVERWRAVLERDPASATATLELMRALEATGKRAEAIDAAHAHRTLMLDEYGADPNPDVEALADRLREAPVGNGIVDLLRGAPATMRTPLHRRRPDWRLPAGLGAAALAFLAFVYAGLGSDEPPAPGEPAAQRVLVAPLANETGDSTLARLGLLAADFISQELRATGLVAVLSPSSTKRDFGGKEGPARTDLEMATLSGADILVSGEIFRRGDSLTFQTRLLDPSTGEIVRSVRAVHGPMEDPTSGLERLRHQVTGALSTVLDPRLAEWTAGASQPPSFEAYQHFADGLDHFFRFEWRPAGEAFQRAAAADSSFTAPLVWSLYAYGNGGLRAQRDSIIDHLLTIENRLSPWDRAQLDRWTADDNFARYDAMKRVAQVSPDSEWRYMLAYSAERLNRPREALKILEDLDPTLGWLADWPSYWGVRVASRHMLGDYAGELEDAHRAVQQFPERKRLLVRPRIGLGQTQYVIDWVERHPEQGPGYVAELLAHGWEEAAQRAIDITLAWLDGLPPEERRSPQSTIQRARLLCMAERWDDAYRILDDFVERSGAYERVLRGVAAAELGWTEVALADIRWLKDQDQPVYDVWATAIMAHLGEREEALSILRRTIGYTAPMNSEFHAWVPLRPLWGDPEFEEILRPKG